MENIPSAVRAKARDAGADAWLDELPALVGQLAREWGLTIGPAFGDATEAYVVRATLAGGEPAVLKLLVPRRGAAAHHEMTVLRLTAGVGCARLLRADPARGALLIERLGPAMSELGLPQPERLKILCDLAAAIWRPPPAHVRATWEAERRTSGRTEDSDRRTDRDGVAGGMDGSAWPKAGGGVDGSARQEAGGGVDGSARQEAGGGVDGSARQEAGGGAEGAERHAADPATGVRQESGGADLPNGATKAARLVDSLARRWRELGRPCTEEAVVHALAAADSRRRAHDPARAVLNHGDVHQWNALRAGDGFKLVDPDGLWAEPECDLGVLMREDPVELMAGDPWDRAHLLARRTGTDPVAIWEWGVARRVGTGLTLTAIGLQPVAAEMLAAADRIAREVRRGAGSAG